MPRIASPYVLHPILQHRYMIHSSHLPGVQLYGKSTQLPSFDNSPVRVDHLGGYINVKGKTKWNDITINCYQFEGITTKSLWSYFKGNHHNVRMGTDKFSNNYKHDIQIWILNPMKIPIGRWVLNDAFISALSWGDMSWDNDAVTECNLTITYDFAIYQGL